MKTLNQLARADLLDRFLRYVRIETTSDRHKGVIPSTEGQWDLLKLLERELREIGVSDIDLTPNGYLIARVPSNTGTAETPAIAFISHVDTAADAPGAGVDPRVHENYDGGVIELGGGVRLDPVEFPALERCRGGAIVTSDGTTLLGADDKAGVAEIMSAVAWMYSHPELPHGVVEILFTPDEETGKGLDRFPFDKLTCRCCYSMDGGEEGVVETECFNAYQVRASFKGKVIHLGSARGHLVNAVTMAGAFLAMLPASESPEATDGRYGYYCPLEVTGNLEEAVVDVFIRDFDSDGIQRRLAVLRGIAAAVESIYRPGAVVLTETHQYSNMNEFIAKDPLVTELLLEAVRGAGMTPELRVIRGGTDGARLSEMGIPTPNVFTGGQNYHSRRELAAVPTMIKAVETILNLVELWAQERGRDRPV